MTHNHGNEYQIKFVWEDGTEELSAWMTNTKQIAHAVRAKHGPGYASYWLRVRNILCSNCSGTEEIIEYPIMMDAASSRYNPHDSRYLEQLGLVNRDAATGGQPREFHRATARTGSSP